MAEPGTAAGAVHACHHIETQHAQSACKALLSSRESTCLWQLSHVLHKCACECLSPKPSIANLTATDAASCCRHRQGERALTAGGVGGGSVGAAAGRCGADRAHIRSSAGAVGGCADGEAGRTGGAAGVGASWARGTCMTCQSA